MDAGRTEPPDPVVADSEDPPPLAPPDDEAAENGALPTLYRRVHVGQPARGASLAENAAAVAARVHATPGTRASAFSHAEGARDVALFNFWANETNLTTRHTPNIGSAVAYFNQTYRAKKLLTAWAEAMEYSTNAQAPDDQVLDTLLKEGLKLMHHFVYKFCSPTRSSLLSGRLPVHVNQENSATEQPLAGIPIEMTIWSVLLQKAGYKTAHIGKCTPAHRCPNPLPTSPRP